MDKWGKWHWFSWDCFFSQPTNSIKALKETTNDYCHLLLILITEAAANFTVKLRGLKAELI